jgi:hypothetical protein
LKVFNVFEKGKYFGSFSASKGYSSLQQFLRHCLSNDPFISNGATGRRYELFMAFLRVLPAAGPIF